MIVELKKGTEVLNLEIADLNLLDVLVPSNLPSGLNEKEIVRTSILNPIGSKPLKNIFNSEDRVVIITSDITRPMPTYKVLPVLVDELLKANVQKENIEVVFARGSHRFHSEDEKKHLMGEMYGVIKCFDSDSEKLVHVGTTSRGTPVDIDERVMKANKRICLGNVEYHYFAGFSGGYKAIMPGVSTPSAITLNHRLMVSEKAKAGNIVDNPVRQDIDEAGKMVGVDFIVNVILNTKKEIIDCFAGDATLAHRAACKKLEAIYASNISEKADIVVVSNGGAPKDLNLYQTQKALDNAGHAIKDNGVIILIGSCIEGFGNKTFEEWMLSYNNPDDMINKLHEHFKLGAHKATAIAMLKKKCDIYFVCDMNEEIVKKTFLKPYKDLNKAYEDALKKVGNSAKVIVMPYGGSTLPILKD